MLSSKRSEVCFTTDRQSYFKVKYATHFFSGDEKKQRLRTLYLTLKFFCVPPPSPRGATEASFLNPPRQLQHNTKNRNDYIVKAVSFFSSGEQPKASLLVKSQILLISNVPTERHFLQNFAVYVLAVLNQVTVHLIIKI